MSEIEFSLNKKSINKNKKEKYAEHRNIPILYRPFLRKLEKQFTKGKLSYLLPNGVSGLIEAEDEGPVAHISLHSWRPLVRLLTKGGVGFAEGYINGEWDSPELQVFIQLVSKNLIHHKNKSLLYNSIKNFIRNFFQKNTRAGSRKNISAHYDLGNDFYAAWLDSTMTYSSAVFTTKNKTLKSAQKMKYKNILKLLDPSPGDHILDIGCGWGGFAIYAAERGYKVTGITISDMQFKYVQDLIKNKKLSKKIDVQFSDYRDISSKFDHIVSIEMIEAVGQSFWSSYFSILSKCLNPGGKCVLQAITIKDDEFFNYSQQTDFIQTYIFPGGMLLSSKLIGKHLESVGMEVVSSKSFGDDYAETLSLWRGRFFKAWPHIKTLGFDDRFKRIWDFYLASCEGSFRGKRINVQQIVARHS